MATRAHTGFPPVALLSLAALWAGAAQAQNWTVGLPVDQMIIDYPANIFVTEICDGLSGQEAEFRIALPPVDGVSYFAVIDHVEHPGDLFELRHGTVAQTLGLGGSLAIVPAFATDTIHLSYAGYEAEMSLRFTAVGMPTVAGQPHPCGSSNDGWYNQPIGCYSPFFPDASTYSVACTVQGPSSISENELLMAWRNGSPMGPVEIVDLHGRVVQRYGPDAGAQRLTGQAPGVYIVRAHLNGRPQVARFVVVE